MCRIGQIKISVLVDAVTRNHGSCSIQVIFVPGLGFALGTRLGFSLVSSLLTKTPRLEGWPLATSRKALRRSDFARAGQVFVYFLERPRTGPRNFPVCSEKTGNCYSIPLRRFVFRTELCAKRERHANAKDHGKEKNERPYFSPKETSGYQAAPVPQAMTPPSYRLVYCS